MSLSLEKAKVRNSLEPRREPYWAAPIARGQFIGLRKIDPERATWIARARTDAGRQEYLSLGLLTPEFDFDRAKAAAAPFFAKVRDGIQTSGEVVTVADACRRYVKERIKSKGEGASHDANKRFERTVYDAPLGSHRLDKLRVGHIRAWRDGLKLSPAASNRTLTALKAALNLSVRERNVAATVAQEWRDVAPLAGANKRRDLFLDLRQRRAMLKAATGAIRDLIEAAMLTGARAGELVNAVVSQFDARTRSMTFSGKTGTRTVPVSAGAAKLFARLAKGKSTADRLFVRDDGKPWAHSDWDQLVRRVAADAKLPKGVCLYTLRHSFVTTALTSGMTTLDVARLVGTSVMMIEKFYGHLVASAARDRLSKVRLV